MFRKSGADSQLRMFASEGFGCFARIGSTQEVSWKIDCGPKRKI
jgi:hypothetical protein